MHEVVAEEYPPLDSVNYELATYSPADWVCLWLTVLTAGARPFRGSRKLGLVSFE